MRSSGPEHFGQCSRSGVVTEKVVSRQWTGFDDRRRLAQMNEDLVSAAAAQRNPAMMLGVREHLMPAGAIMQRNPFSAAIDLDTAAMFAYPDVFSRKLPAD